MVVISCLASRVNTGQGERDEVSWLEKSTHIRCDLSRWDSKLLLLGVKSSFSLTDLSLSSTQGILGLNDAMGMVLSPPCGCTSWIGVVLKMLGGQRA